jgi:hypothetical protein
MCQLSADVFLRDHNIQRSRRADRKTIFRVKKGGSIFDSCQPSVSIMGQSGGNVIRTFVEVLRCTVIAIALIQFIP